MSEITDKPTIAAIVLAAGCSTRMGECNKLLETVQGKPMIRWVVEAALNSLVQSTTVITGFESEKIIACLSDLDVRVVHNPDYATGIASSLRVGIESAVTSDDAMVDSAMVDSAMVNSALIDNTLIDGALILLADMPFIQATHINALVTRFNESNVTDIIVPSHNGRRGNPVLWPNYYFPQLGNLQGDTGARTLLRRYAARVCSVAIDSNAVHLDIDTNDALREANQVNSNVYALFQQRFPDDRNKAFLSNGSDVVVSYAELERRSAQLASFFIQLGLQKGDRVAVQVKKSPQALMTYLAALRAGLVYLPLNTGYTRSELEYFLSDAGPRFVICDPDNEQQFQQLTDGYEKPPHIKTLANNGEGSLTQGANNCADSFATVQCFGSELAAILYTSGTTGRPKGAMLSHGNLSSNAFTLARLWGWREDDVLLHALPIFHVHGLFVACHCVLAVGASMIFLPGFDTDQVIEYLPSATVMMGVPTFYTRLLANPKFTRQVSNTMRLFISGSAPMLEGTHNTFYQRTGQVILERYGMTETGMLLSNPLAGERRPGTVGLPLPDVDVRIVNIQQHRVKPGEVGSIQVKGPNVFQGYWQMPEKTAQEFTEDGFFITGDQGMISEDGYIAIVGRAKDMVISGGYNVYPKEVEHVIDTIPGVKESAVFGVADADFGEAVCAAIVSDGHIELNAAAIIAAARQSLAGYKVPKRIIFLQDLPRNTMGKVQKNKLRENVNTLVR